MRGLSTYYPWNGLFAVYDYFCCKEYFRIYPTYFCKSDKPFFMNALYQ